jgi:hypothetical protein
MGKKVYFREGKIGKTSTHDMQKEIYIFRGSATESYGHFRKRMFELGEALLETCRPLALKASLTTRRPPMIHIIPFKRRKVAVFSLTGKTKDVTALLSETRGFSGAYLVEEAIPRAYEKTWEDREPTPGVCLLTLFHRKPGLDQELFVKRWFEGHTPLSLKLHPLWNYNRNRVTEETTGRGAWYDGIVEEQFRERSHLLNPWVFFGPTLKVPRHMFQVYTDTRGFIDMKNIETYLATEVHFLAK